MFALFLPLASALSANAVVVPVASGGSIQTAIDSANNGDTVLVAAGIYHQHIDFKGKAITVKAEDPDATKTILDGDNVGAVVVFQNNETSDSVLTGFTIQNGGAPDRTQNIDATHPVNYGGVYLRGARAKIQNNIFTSNACTGVAVYDAGATVQNNIITLTKNPVDSTSTPVYCGLAAAAVFVYASDGTMVYENMISGNAVATSAGAAVVVQNTRAFSVTGNLIYGNTVAIGGISLNLPTIDFPGEVSSYISGNTVADNVAADGSGLPQINLAGDISAQLVMNNLLSTATTTAPLNCNTAGTLPASIDHNVFAVASGNGISGVSDCTMQEDNFGNITTGSAGFVDAATGDYHLAAGSPAIDAGVNSFNVGKGDDLDSAPRFQDGAGMGYPIVDAGAYEYVGVYSTLDNTLLSLQASQYVATDSALTLKVFPSYARAYPTGNMNFYDNGTLIGSSPMDRDTATYMVPALSRGLHAYSVTYDGDPVHNPSMSAHAYVLNAKHPTQTTISFTPSTFAAYDATTLDIAVTPASSATGVPSGTVNVLLSGTGGGLTSVTLDSSGRYRGSFFWPTPGTYTVTATYKGDSIFQGSTATTTITVLPVVITATSISLTANPTIATIGTPVTLSATLSSNNPSRLARGVLTFRDGSTILGTATAAGTATLTTSTLSAGTHSITATYEGNVQFTASTSNAATVTIVAPGFTITAPNPIEIKAEHHTTVQVKVASGNGFADTVQLECANLPAHATCIFRPAQMALAANGSAETALYIDTSDVIGFKSEVVTTRDVYLAMLPLGALLLWGLRGRKRLPLLLVALAMIVLPVSGCSGKYPAYVAPGTYNIQITGHGASTGASQTTTIKLVVTQP